MEVADQTAREQNGRCHERDVIYARLLDLDRSHTLTSTLQLSLYLLEARDY